MADLTQTLSENVNVFGVAPSNKWNEYNWGSFLWGEGTNKVKTETDADISDSTTGISDAIRGNPDARISDEISPTSDLSSETLKDSEGYFYVFQSNTTEGEDRDIASYTSQAAGSTTYTSQAAASVIWS